MAIDIDGQGIAAIIIGTGTAIASIIAVVRAQGNAAKKAKKDAPEDRPELPPVPETMDPDLVLGFLKEVRADNVDLRHRDEEKDRKIAGMQEDLDTMAGELRMALKIQEAFMRWIPVIFRNWGKTATPPLPEGEDLITLQEFIPRG